MGEVLSVYVRIILEFLFELYVFCALVTLRLGRAKHFALKVLAGLVCIAAVALGAAFFYVQFGGVVWGRAVVYLVLFALVTLHARFCFDEPYKTVLFCCSAAYAAQNLTYKLFLFLWGFGEQLRWYDSWGENFELYYRIIYYAFFIAAAAASYFLFIRPLVRRLPGQDVNFRMLAISLVVLAVTIVLCSFEDIFFADLSVGREGRFDEPVYFVLWQTGNAFSVVCCAVVLLLISRTLERSELAHEVQYLQYEVRQRAQQYEISKDTIDMINVKCHDIKYKIGALLAQKGVPDAADVSDLYESISIYDTKVETGNTMLDVLLTEKSLYCEQNGITFSCMAQGDKLGFLSDGDLYCLFGNIIDNALEAVRSLLEKERRVINLVVKAKNGLLLVQEENYFAGELQFRDWLPVTTKEDKNYHGFGTRSIRMIAHKYGGELSTSVQDGVFRLNIVFCLSDERTQQNK